jgi:hypothetical protein
MKSSAKIQQKDESSHSKREAASEAARALAKRSVLARKKKWGAKEFKRRMQVWGKLGGRPKKNQKEKS